MGDCFDDSDEWWTMDCSASGAFYKVVDTVVYDEPVADMNDDGGRGGRDLRQRLVLADKDNQDRTSASSAATTCSATARGALSATGPE